LKNPRYYVKDDESPLQNPEVLVLTQEKTFVGSRVQISKHGDAIVAISDLVGAG
jgi:hypothetical protein